MNIRGISAIRTIISVKSSTKYNRFVIEPLKSTTMDINIDVRQMKKKQNKWDKVYRYEMIKSDFLSEFILKNAFIRNPNEIKLGKIAKILLNYFKNLFNYLFLKLSFIS